MELHKALQHIIQTEGQNILKETRLVNILDDFNAYQDIPASKYILRAIIAEGYTNKLLALGKWDNRAEILSQKFSAMTGFIPESVSVIFQSIAFGLGWVNSINHGQAGNAQNQQTKPLPNKPLSSRPTIKSAWRAGMTDDEKEQYIFSLLEYDNSKESHLHVKLENLSFEVNENEEIEITGEIKKNGNVYHATLRAALYDLRGRLKDIDTVGFINDNDISLKPIWSIWRKPLASQISKIRLYWED